MSYQSELSFVCEIFKKNHIGAKIVKLSDLQNAFSESALSDFFDHKPIFPEILNSVSPKTVYRLTDSFEFCYRLLLLPDTDPETLFYIGPFLSSPVSQKHILEIGERHSISPQKLRYLAEYYNSIPIISGDSRILTVFSAFCERIWHTPSFNIVDVTQDNTYVSDLVSRTMMDLKLDDTMVNIKALERRYEFENELLRAVYLGQPHMENMFKVAFSTEFFEKRHSDPLRNAKNYSIIMNTLLRKAAEQGGVHPLHLDQISAEFASKIENLSSVSDISSLMLEMFRAYCRLVRKHSLQKYSPIVQNTILLIDADLSADLSPSALAESQSISLGYLSTVFKKETAQTVSEYIREKRMKYAAYLLRTTKLQIQSIALHCGIMDVQYFSKLFKNYHNKTPSEYRTEAANKLAPSSTV